MTIFDAPSTLPYALPDFANLTTDQYRPAFDAGIAEHLAEIEAIATNPEPATIENVLHAFDLSGQKLRRVLHVFYNATSADATEEITELEAYIGPAFAKHSDDVYLNAAFYRRCQELAAAQERGQIEFDDQDAWRLHLLQQEFARAGVHLDEAGQEKVRALNVRLAELEAEFSKRALAELNDSAVHITDRAELAGLSEEAIEAAAAAAQRRGLDGFLLELDSATPQVELEALTDPATRHRLLYASLARGGRGNANDTRDLIVQIARLRAEKAELLGFANYVEYATADACAKNAQAVADLLTELAPRAIRNAKREAELMTTLLREERPDAELTASDWHFVSERARAAQFDVDDEAMRVYFEVNSVLQEGVFAAATALYGITFTRRDDLVGYHPDVEVYEVHNEDGTELGLFLLDIYTRDTKQGGAWMNNLVDGSGLHGTKPVVVNNHNVVKPPPGQPTLLSWDEVITFFHEFGHALHGLFADSRYQATSGAQTPRDFVEYPSQVNEMWAWDRQILARYARHHATGEPLPSDVIERKLASRTWGEGFKTTEYLGAALLDHAWHALRPDEVPSSSDEVYVFEEEALTAAGVNYPLVPPRYRTPYFRHAWDYGYSGAYYSYLWSEAMDADTGAWFAENGGLSRQNGERFRRELLAPGGSVDPMVTFERFRGRPVELAHLLQRRGLTE